MCTLIVIQKFQATLGDENKRKLANRGSWFLRVSRVKKTLRKQKPSRGLLIMN